MSNQPGKFRVFLANLAWLLTCIPGWIAFLFASRNIQQTQLSLLSRILNRNANTDFGREHHFDSISTPEQFRAIPLSEYEDYACSIEAIKTGKSAVLTSDPVELLQPTSGSNAATKLIPYTKSLRDEFKAAIAPWIASLYLANPPILLGRHYWSISPSTAYPAACSFKVRIGFADDSEYLGAIQRCLTRTLFTVPAEISKVTDPDAFEYLTLLFLCREKNLRVISIWHPSFLTALFKALPGHFQSIIHDIESGTISPSVPLDSGTRSKLASRLSPYPARARELAQIGATAPGWLQSLWPRLRIVSCWTDGVSEPWVTELATSFPRATIQGKGLAATEGIVSFPLGKSGKKVCAVRSHYLELVDPESGKIQNAWEVETGKEYSIILTTGGGLYRYQLHDLVRVTGFFRQAPCLTFISRDNLVSDMVGEKLNVGHVEESIRHIERTLGHGFLFAMLTPLLDGQCAGYVLYVQPAKGSEVDYQRVARLMEAELSRNYHYLHARRLSQLGPIRVFRVDEDAEVIYRRHLIQKGMRPGDIKFQALSVDRTWSTRFAGEYVA